jgi:hypothetical protein
MNQKLNHNRVHPAYWGVLSPNPNHKGYQKTEILIGLLQTQYINFHKLVKEIPGALPKRTTNNRSIL